jgi:hypothetical protein
LQSGSTPEWIGAREASVRGQRALDVTVQISAFGKLKLANCARLSVRVIVACISHCCLQWRSGDNAQPIPRRGRVKLGRRDLDFIVFRLYFQLTGRSPPDRASYERLSRGAFSPWPAHQANEVHFGRTKSKFTNENNGRKRHLSEFWLFGLASSLAHAAWLGRPQYGRPLFPACIFR